MAAFSEKKTTKNYKVIGSKGHWSVTVIDYYTVISNTCFKHMETSTLQKKSANTDRVSRVLWEENTPENADTLQLVLHMQK